MSDLSGLTAAQRVAAARVLLTVPAGDEVHHDTAHSARTVVDVTGGRVTLGWDRLTDGVWLGDGMDQVRTTHKLSKPLLGVLAACVRCCWPDPDKPLYPGAATTRAKVLEAYGTLGSATDDAGSTEMASRHAKGALKTLEAAGLIEPGDGEDTLRLGPLVATWPARDEDLLRAHWHRLPAVRTVGRHTA